MISPQDFIASYTEKQRPDIACAWQGEGETLGDANMEFRAQVVEYCLAHPDQASPELLEHLFLADAEWSGEAWCSADNFTELGTLLLVRGQEAVLDSFMEGCLWSFDTLGASHQIDLDSALIARLSATLNERLAGASDEDQKAQLETMIEMFAKFQNRTAKQGWIRIDP